MQETPGRTLVWSYLQQITLHLTSYNNNARERNFFLLAGTSGTNQSCREKSSRIVGNARTKSSSRWTSSFARTRCSFTKSTIYVNSQFLVHQHFTNSNQQHFPFPLYLVWFAQLHYHLQTHSQVQLTHSPLRLSTCLLCLESGPGFPLLLIAPLLSSQTQDR